MQDRSNTIVEHNLKQLLICALGIGPPCQVQVPTTWTSGSNRASSTGCRHGTWCAPASSSRCASGTTGSWSTWAWMPTWRVPASISETDIPQTGRSGESSAPGSGGKGKGGELAPEIARASPPAKSAREDGGRAPSWGTKEEVQDQQEAPTGDVEQVQALWRRWEPPLSRAGEGIALSTSLIGSRLVKTRRSMRMRGAGEDGMERGAPGWALCCGGGRLPPPPPPRTPDRRQWLATPSSWSQDKWGRRLVQASESSGGPPLAFWESRAVLD